MSIYKLQFNGDSEMGEIFECETDAGAIDMAEDYIETVMHPAETCCLCWGGAWDADGVNEDGFPCERLLVWASEEDAENDAGEKALAQLTVVRTERQAVI